jgi:4-alpha-glucanotransferase
VLVGEDLGTVPAAVRQTLRRHGIHRTYVAQFELRPDPEPVLPAPDHQAFASLNTHDMAPWAAFRHGDDIELSRSLGLITDHEAHSARRQRERLLAALRRFLDHEDVLDDDDADGILGGVLSLLASSDAAAVIANLEDLWGERRQQNVPGTVGPSNWRGRLRYPVEDLDVPEVDRLLRRIDERRRALVGDRR